MKLISDNINISNWEDLIRSVSTSTPFQTPSFYNFIKSINSYNAFAFGVEENDNLVAVCVVTIQKEQGLKSYFTRRAIIYGGPVYRPSNLDALNFLIKSINIELRRKVIYIECRNSEYNAQAKSIFEENGWTYIPYLNVQLSLANKTLEEILSSMPYNRRREIKQTINEGVTWNICRSEEELKELYAILKELYKMRVKLPLPKYDYFQKQYQLEISKIFIIKHDNKIIGGSICLFLPQSSIFTMYYCGLRNYSSKIFPTHIAILAAIQFGIQYGIKKFDFMGAGKPGEEYGVREYKSKFGGEILESGRFIKVFNPLLYNIGKMGLQLLKKIG